MSGGGPKGAEGRAAPRMDGWAEPGRWPPTLLMTTGGMEAVKSFRNKVEAELELLYLRGYGIGRGLILLGGA